MATEKLFLLLVLLLFFDITVKGECKQNKYSQTSYNFPDTNIVNFVNIKEAIDFVIQLADGDVTKAERKFKKDIPIWKVDFITKDKGRVEVELSAMDKSLIRIDSDEGPFEYEIKPFNNLISYKEAKMKAEQTSGQKVLKWNFFKNKNSWEYNFWLFVKSGKAQLRIDAESGEIISAKKKK